jgi:hypothetical protein
MFCSNEIRFSKKKRESSNKLKLTAMLHGQKKKNNNPAANTKRKQSFGFVIIKELVGAMLHM